MSSYGKIIKTILLLVALSFAVCLACILTACGEQHTLTYVAAKSATCTEEGNLEYWVCADCGKIFSDEEGTQETALADVTLPAAGHDWDLTSVDWEWDGYGSATATFTCSRDTAHTDSVTATGNAVTSETLAAATCTEEGKTTHTATVTFAGQTFSDNVTETAEPLGHDWDTENIKWSWSGYESATATVACSRDPSHTQTFDATVSENVTKQPTCTEKGSVMYTALIEFDGQNYINTKTETLNSLGHVWDTQNIRWDWSPDHISVNATLYCTNDPSHTQTALATGGGITSETTKPATCDEPGVITYTATVKFFNRSYVGKTTVDVDPLGHDWNTEDIEWNWTGYGSAAATFTCRRDPSHTQTVNATMSDSVTAPSSCEVSGARRHVATVVFNGKQYTDERTETLAPLGHDWEVSWNWNDDHTAATAIFTCNNDAAHTSTQNAVITETVTEEPDCDGGTKTCTATVKYEGKEYTDVVTGVAVPAKHNYVDGVCTLCGAEQISEGLEFSLSYDNTYYELTGMGTCKDTEVYVPSEYNGLPVRSVSSYFFGADFIKKIVIPDSVTNIGMGALRNCETIEEVTVPFMGDSKKTATDPMQYTFGYIFSAYVLHDGWISVKTSYVQSVDKSNGWPTVVNPEYGMTLYLPTTLKKVTVTGGIVMHSAFRGFSMLEEIVLPKDIEYIGGYAFADCTSLRSIEIPSTVKYIHDFAFKNCRSLKSLTIPDSVQSMGTEWSGGANILSGCMGLESLTIPFVGSSLNDTLLLFGSLFGRPDNSEILDLGYYAEQKYDASGKNAPAFLPNSLKTVTVTGGNLSQYGVFYGCRFDTLIVKSKSCNAIGAYAFYTGSITSVVLPATVRQIQTHAFTDTALQYVYFEGTAEQYNITVGTAGSGNNNFTSAEKLYYSETQPTEAGNYWHYVDGLPVAW